MATTIRLVVAIPVAVVGLVFLAVGMPFVVVGGMIFNVASRIVGKWER